jgi:hypothetical protein
MSTKREKKEEEPPHRIYKRERERKVRTKR